MASAWDPSVKRPRISVVIPAKNAVSTIDRQLEALARQVCGESFEVIVADNGSDDSTREAVPKGTSR